MTALPGLVERKLGGAAYSVTVAGVTVPADALSLVSITRGRARPDQRPEAATCSLVIGTERTGVLPVVGDPVTVDLSEQARTYLGLAAGHQALKRFRGKVTDADAASTGNVGGPARITVVATGPRSRLLPLQVGGGAWPAEDDAARAGRIVAEAITQDASLVAGVHDPGTVTVLSRDTGSKAGAGFLLDELAVSSGGELVEQRDGSLVWHDALHRRNLLPALTLNAGQVLKDSARAQQQLAGLVNDVTLTWDVDAAGSVRITDPESADPVTGYGPVPLSLATILTSEDDATTRAKDVVGRYSVPRWRMDKLAVELLRTIGAAGAAQLLALDFGQLLQVQGFPNTGPFTAARLFVEGMTEASTRDGWQLALNVGDYALTGAAPLWADLTDQAQLRYRQPPDSSTRYWSTTGAGGGPTWADLAANEPTLTWLAAVGWDVESPSLDRWLDQPADRSWADTDPTTWAAFTGT